MVHPASFSFGDLLWLVSVTGLALAAIASSLSFGLRSVRTQTLEELAGLDAIYS